MQNSVLNNILSLNEITDLLTNPIVETNKEQLSTQNVVKFSIEVTNDIKTKLENALSLDLSHISSIPMRWIKGDTLPHIDKGEKYFNTTHLIYLTDSIGSLIVDGVTYPIVAGDAHIFSEGLEHSTINTGNSERLLIGPMSESGDGVGAGGIFYYNNIDDAIYGFNNAGAGYIGTSNYTLITIGNISSWVIYNNTFGAGASTGGPYTSGDELVTIGLYYLYPYIPPTSTICFPAGTPIQCDQGIIPIETINSLKHTINNKPIVDITKTITGDKYLVGFKKNALGLNYPNDNTIMSQEHKVYYKGTMRDAKSFLGKFEGVKKVKYTGEILYNVLMEDYSKMRVNNLTCETLDPNNIIAKLYTKKCKYTIKKRDKIVGLLKECLQKKDYNTYNNIVQRC
jgi:hypothetical protein